jgi:hypothetical protein
MADISVDAFKLAGFVGIALGAASVLSGVFGAATAGWVALKAGAAKAAFSKVAVGMGTGLLGYGLFKAPDWAAGTPTAGK